MYNDELSKLMSGKQTHAWDSGVHPDEPRQIERVQQRRSVHQTPPYLVGHHTCMHNSLRSLTSSRCLQLLYVRTPFYQRRIPRTILDFNPNKECARQRVNPNPHKPRFCCTWTNLHIAKAVVLSLLSAGTPRQTQIFVLKVHEMRQKNTS